jgi:hypothetical protein
MPLHPQPGSARLRKTQLSLDIQGDEPCDLGHVGAWAETSSVQTPESPVSAGSPAGSPLPGISDSLGGSSTFMPFVLDDDELLKFKASSATSPNRTPVVAVARFK